MTGRHVLAPRHSAATPDLIQPLADLIRDTADLPAIRTAPADPMNPRPDLPPIPPEMRAHAATWANRPPEWDAVLTEVHPGQVRAEPDTWGGRGRALHAS